MIKKISNSTMNLNFSSTTFLRLSALAASEATYTLKVVSSLGFHPAAVTCTRISISATAQLHRWSLPVATLCCCLFLCACFIASLASRTWGWGEEKKGRGKKKEKKEKKGKDKKGKGKKENRGKEKWII
jgi:hypothetical protein